MIKALYHKRHIKELMSATIKYKLQPFSSSAYNGALQICIGIGSKGSFAPPNFGLSRF